MMFNKHFDLERYGKKDGWWLVESIQGLHILAYIGLGPRL